MSHPLTIRRPFFDFQGISFHWHPSPALSAIGNATSFGAVAFERMVVHAVRDALPLITDDALHAEAKAFIAQEAVHSAAHRAHVRALVETHPELSGTQERVDALCDALFGERSLKARLGFAAVLEGVLPAVARHMIETRDTLFRGADPRVSALLMWHFCEEIEHEATAVLLFQHLYPGSWRAARIPLALKFVATFTRLMEREFSDHAPARRRSDRWSHDLEWQRIGRLVRRTALSPWPSYAPEDERMPDWAGRYLDDIASGADPVAAMA